MKTVYISPVSKDDEVIDLIEIALELTRASTNLNGLTLRNRTMRPIFAGIIMLSVSTTVVQAAQTEKHGYIQAVIGHRQPSQDNTVGADQGHSEQDVLTKRIEQNNSRLARLIDICPSC
jgi:hypothetical protein